MGLGNRRMIQARKQTTAAHRRDQCIDLWAIFEDFIDHRAVPLPQHRVIESRDIFGVRTLRQLNGPLVGFVPDLAVDNHLGAGFAKGVPTDRGIMKISVRLAFVAFVSTLAYLWLAIWGLGGFAAFFSHGALVVVALATLAMVVASLFTEVNLSSGEREDRANRWVLPAFGIIGLLSGFLPAYTDRVDFWTFGGEGVRWLGAVLYILGGALRIWPVFVLGKRFSGLVAIQPGHSLVTDGIYRRLRNPSYLGMLIIAVGWALAFRSAVGLLLAALTVIPLIARIDSEEALLRAQFGADYEAYCTRSWRLIPKIY